MDKKSNRGVMLSISVLLHGLLALLPWQEKSPHLAVSSTPANPISVVDASQLPTLPASESQSAPSSPPTPVVPLSPPVDPSPADWIADAPFPETSDVPEPASDTVPDADWTADALIPETSDVPEPTPEATPDSNSFPAAVSSTSTPVTPADDEVKIAADWDHLVGYLKNQGDGFDSYELFDIFDIFGKPGQVNQFFDENGDSKVHVFDFEHFTKQTPEQVFQTVVMPELTSSTDFDPQLQENFSAGLAYQLLQGEMLRYLLIVKLNEGSGSVLLLSDSLAGLDP